MLLAYYSFLNNDLILWKLLTHFPSSRGPFFERAVKWLQNWQSVWECWVKSIKWAFRPIAQPTPWTEYSRQHRKSFHFGQPYWFAMSGVGTEPREQWTCSPLRPCGVSSPDSRRRDTCPSRGNNRSDTLWKKSRVSQGSPFSGPATAACAGWRCLG